MWYVPMKCETKESGKWERYTHTHTIAYGENKLSATSIERLGILLRVVSLGLISVLVERRTRKIYVIFCASFPMRFVRKMLIRKWRIVRDRGTYYAHATNIIHENESLRMISIHTKERKLFFAAAAAHRFVHAQYQHIRNRIDQQTCVNRSSLDAIEIQYLLLLLLRIFTI